MKRIYITVNLKRYSVAVRKVETNSNYDTGINIHEVGQKLPIWGTIIKSTDNVREYAKAVIKSWE